MRINKIELYNIGSYEGINEFDIAAQSTQGKIVLVGGKNGAGKTTVFTAIKLCLYGYKELGYASASAHYKNRIKKLVNDRAKLESNPKSHVLLQFSIMNGQDWDQYSMCRAWNLNETPFEELSVEKNGAVLDEEEIADFENYLMNLLPPELFELYFFDGEEIAEFFLDEKNTSRLKEAFLTLCGYDTFEILFKCFKKMARENASSGDDYVNLFLEAEDSLYHAQKELKECERNIAETTLKIEELTGEQDKLERDYRNSGGLSLDEWKAMFAEMKAEETLREERNSWLKVAANEQLPFIILRQQLTNLLEQAEAEREQDLQEGILAAINSILPQVLQNVVENQKISHSAAEEILNQMMEQAQGPEKPVERILNLSKSEYSQINGSVTNLLKIDADVIINCRRDINDSIERSKAFRENMSASSIEGYEGFNREKEELLKKKAQAYAEKDNLSTKKLELEAVCAKRSSEYTKAEKAWEHALKSESISGLTGKTIHFLEKLQKRLYESEKKKVEQLFMEKMSQLMRKNHFIDKIEIGENFEIHVYKRIVIECRGVCENILQLGEEKYVKEYGEVHCGDILRVTNCRSLSEFIEKYRRSNEIIDVMLEFDKETMSKGEKQVFIMSLYWAIMQLCPKDIPFIIDTPFARIDTEHRAHITRKFFKELNGQVFIFSTDEEITQEHLDVIGDDLQAKFLIENVDNTKTTIKENAYFGE